MRRRDLLAGIASMGAIASLPTGVAHAGTLTVSIANTNAPVVGGNQLRVSVDVTNPSSDAVSETIELLDSSGTVLDSTDVSLAESSSVTTTLAYTTYDTAVEVTFPITVRSHGDADSQSVTVVPQGTGSLGVSIERTTAPVTGGEYLEVLVSLGNGASHEVTDTVELFDSSGTLLDSQERTLPRESTAYAALGWDTYPVSSTVEFPVTVESSGDSDSQQVTVYGT